MKYKPSQSKAQTKACVALLLFLENHEQTIFDVFFLVIEGL